MTAIIRMPTYKQQVSVKEKTVDGSGYVRIVADDGVIYETHLTNVVFVDDGGKYVKE